MQIPRMIHTKSQVFLRITSACPLSPYRFIFYNFISYFQLFAHLFLVISIFYSNFLYSYIFLILKNIF